MKFPCFYLGPLNKNVDQQPVTENPKVRTKEVPLKKPKKTHGRRRGYFIPSNPQKYEGDVTKIIYRSNLELKMMKYLDSHPSILKWSSEETIIPYYSPLDNKMHRYFVDFKVTTKTKDDKLITRLVEVKWSTATVKPKEPKSKKKTRRYFVEQKNWIINQAKWEAAKLHCDKRGWEWMILTEKHLSY
jgi:hypothetical protein